MSCNDKAWWDVEVTPRRFLVYFVTLILTLSIDMVFAQAVKTIPCPEGKASLYKCIPSNEACGWRNERPTADELRQAERGDFVLVAPCPTLSSGIELKHCYIDRVHYCKVPTATDIAAAQRAKREKEERTQQEKMAAERKRAAIASETARLGAHRGAEAQRLVELREKAEQARGANCQGTKPIKISGHSDPDSFATPNALFPGWSTREKAMTSARRYLGRNCKNHTGDSSFSNEKESCKQDSFQKWICTLEVICSKQVPKCPVGAQ